MTFLGTDWWINRQERPLPIPDIPVPVSDLKNYIKCEHLTPWQKSGCRLLQSTRFGKSSNLGGHLFQTAEVMLSSSDCNYVTGAHSWIPYQQNSDSTVYHVSISHILIDCLFGRHSTLNIVDIPSTIWYFFFDIILFYHRVSSLSCCILLVNSIIVSSTLRALKSNVILFIYSREL